MTYLKPRLLGGLVVAMMVGGVFGYQYAKGIDKNQSEMVAVNEASDFEQVNKCPTDLLQIDKSKETIGNDDKAADLLKQYCLWAFDYQKSDFTGEGQEERALIGVGAGCASCHAKTLIIFNDEKELFRKEFDDLIFRAPEDKMGFITIRPISLVQEGACCPTSGILTEYRYRQGNGFEALKEEIVPFK